MKFLNVLFFGFLMFTSVNTSQAFEEGTYEGKWANDKCFLMVKALPERKGSFLAVLIRNYSGDSHDGNIFLIDPRPGSKYVGYGLNLDKNSNLTRNFSIPDVEIINVSEEKITFKSDINYYKFTIQMKKDNGTWTWQDPFSGRFKQQSSYGNFPMTLGDFDIPSQTMAGTSNSDLPSQFNLKRQMSSLFSVRGSQEINGELIFKPAESFAIFARREYTFSKSYKLLVIKNQNGSSLEGVTEYNFYK